MAIPQPDPLSTAADSSPPLPGRIYRPELDLLRFFAFLSVYLFHSININAGGRLMQHRTLAYLLPMVRASLACGLCLFFFLSSFLITSLLQVEQQRTGSIHLRHFYLRRVLRIWPLYLAYLFAMWVIGHWWAIASISPGRLAAFLCLGANWFCLAFGMGSPLIFHLWSISVEEQFYLLWPALLRALHPRILFVASIAMCGASLVNVYLLAVAGVSLRSIWINSLVQALFFAGGAVLALILGIRPRLPSLLRSASGIAAGSLLWLTTAGFCSITEPRGPVTPWRLTLSYALVALGCGLLLWGFLHLPPLLLPRPLLYLGRISYGLYVYHVLALTVIGGLPLPGALRLPGMAILIGLLLTISWAAVSYALLEKPFLRLKLRFEFIRTRAV